MLYVSLTVFSLFFICFVFSIYISINAHTNLSRASPSSASSCGCHALNQIFFYIASTNTSHCTHINASTIKHGICTFIIFNYMLLKWWKKYIENESVDLSVISKHMFTKKSKWKFKLKGWICILFYIISTSRWRQTN